MPSLLSGTGAAPTPSPQAGLCGHGGDGPKQHSQSPEPRGCPQRATPPARAGSQSCSAHGETEARRGLCLDQARSVARTRAGDHHHHRSGSPPPGEHKCSPIWDTATWVWSPSQDPLPSRWVPRTEAIEGSPAATLHQAGSTVPDPAPIAALPGTSPQHRPVAGSRPRSRGCRYRHPFPPKNSPPRQGAGGLAASTPKTLPVQTPTPSPHPKGPPPRCPVPGWGLRAQGAGGPRCHRALPPARDPREPESNGGVRASGSSGAACASPRHPPAVAAAEVTHVTAKNTHGGGTGASAGERR